MGYVFGIKGLDEALVDSIRDGALVIITGHPGSGKTILASTVCYTNSLRGKRCLYISFQEYRERLFRMLGRLGIHLEHAEDEGFLEYVRLPVLVKSSQLVDEIIKLVSKSDPDIIVVDSITPLMAAMRKRVSARSYLQDFFHTLASKFGKLVVLVDELMPGDAKKSSTGIEFVADVIIVLRHRVVRNILIRELEIMKARGSSLNVARAPFTISEGHGLQVWMPVVLEEIPARGEEVISPPCKPFNNVIGPLRRGDVVVVSHPPDASPSFVYEGPLGLITARGLRGYVLSFMRPAREILDILSELWGVDRGVLEAKLGDRLVIDSMNPTATETAQVVAYTVESIRAIKPDVVVVDGPDLVYELADRKEYISALYNLIKWYKKMNILSMRIVAETSPEVYNVYARLADVVIRFQKVEGGEKTEWRVYMWRVGREPAIVSHEYVAECQKMIRQEVLKALRD